MGRKQTIVAGSVAPWSGRAVTRARTHMATRTTWPHTCPRCGKPVHPDAPGTAPGKSSWVVGHIKDRATHPELTWESSNWRVEHRKCSDRTGQAAVIAKAKAEALRDAGFPQTQGAGESPPLPLHTHGIPARLTWAHFTKTAPDWYAPILDVPADAAPPLAITPTHPRATGSYGPEAIAWMEERLRERGRPLQLRWWQRLAMWRQLEHDAEGRLVWPFVVESTSRRSGKSTRLRGSALWRLEHGSRLFEPDQIVMHTGRDLAICREIIRKAWPWAEAQADGAWATKRGMTEPEVSFEETNRWVVRSKDSTTGYDTCLALVDEAWDVPASAVDDDLEPAMLERESPQLVLTSTAHRRATSLMRGRMKGALVGEDGKTLLLWWGAPAGADYSDPEVWRAASPYWSEARAEMIAAKYEKAAAGEQDEEFDDPDPMTGFAAQYLNSADVWLTGNERQQPGSPIIEAEPWGALTAPAPEREPDSVAVEAWFADGVSVARAWKLDDGPVVVAVSDFPDLPAAAAFVASLGARKPALVGMSLTDHATWREHKVRLTKMADSTRSQVGDLIRFLKEQAFVHSGSPSLTSQVLELRVSPGVDGPRLRSTGRADAIKAATWAVGEAMNARPRMVLPSRYRRAS